MENAVKLVEAVREVFEPVLLFLQNLNPWASIYIVDAICSFNNCLRYSV